MEKANLPRKNNIGRLTARLSTTVVLSKAVKLIFLVGMCYVMLYPMLFIFSTSFMTLDDMYNPSVIWLPRAASLEAMKTAFSLIKYPDAFMKTIAITIPSALLQILTVLLAGYGFARFKFWGRNILFGILIFSIIVPVQSYIIPLYDNMKNFDFFGIGSLIGLFTGTPVTTSLLDQEYLFYIMAFFGAGIRSGLCVFIIRQFYRNMPKELEEAAMIDGCGPMKTFVRVMLPNTLPMIATVFLFSVVWYWNDYYLSSMFFRTEFPLSVNLTMLRTTLVTLSQQLSGVGGMSGQELILMREPILSCGCLLVIMPLVVLYIFVQRFFTEGVERSGIVG
ncbi:MAG: carbohydrate ABC transporter permease [Oscillospiraceae bacterium]